MTKPTKWHVRPAKTQINLGVRPVWSESSLSAWRKVGSLATHWAHSEDSNTLIRLSGCPGWSASSLGAHSFCWFYHEAAHLVLVTVAFCSLPLVYSLFYFFLVWFRVMELQSESLTKVSQCRPLSIPSKLVSASICCWLQGVLLHGTLTIYSLKPHLNERCEKKKEENELKITRSYNVYAFAYIWLDFMAICCLTKF